MKKILLSIFATVLLIAAAVGFCACGAGNPEAPTLVQFTGVTLADLTVTYDGQPHAVAVQGTLPDAAQVDYENNEKTDAGVYAVKATLRKEGYETKVLTATLTIEKAQFTGVTLDNEEHFYFSDKTYSLAVKGELPAGTQVSYENNGKHEVGEYTVTATLTNPNYVTKVLSAKLTIKSKVETAVAVAKDIVDLLLEKPDPWSFLPDALQPEQMAYSQTPVGGIDGFAAFTPVSRIAKKSIGKQFHVLYEGLNDAASLMGKIDAVYSAGAAIAEVYQNFINKNPDNYAQFTGEAAGFKVKIVLNGENSMMLAGNSAVSIELSYEKQTETRTGRVQITDGAAVKYVSSPNRLKFAVKVTAAGVGNLKQIEFIRNDGAVAGYLKEFTGTETKNLKTTGVIASDAKTTVIMSNKRESDDLKINGYEEAYSSVTGEYLGGEVLETVKLFDYDTLWFHLADVAGLESVRVTDEQNGLNADTVYLNGQTAPISTKVNALKASRRFDIEMKEVWYVATETQDGKTEYHLQKTLVPMLFVQKENMNTFAADFKEKNAYIAATALSSQKVAAVEEHFESLKALFDAALEEVSYQDIVLYIGEKNSFFNA